jgi:hypothetical protein
MALLSLKTLAAASLLIAGARSSTATAPRPPGEYEVKAAFLCSFPDFVEWPSRTNDVVTIGVLGEDPFGSSLVETVRARARESRTLVVRHLNRLDEARECQVLFVSESETPRLGQIFRTLDGATILTVSDIAGFAGRGGVIGFTLEEKRVRFEINTDAAERAGLRVSSRLLKLAHIVRTAPNRGAS